MSPSSLENINSWFPWLSDQAVLTVLVCSLASVVLTWGVMFIWLRRGLRIREHELKLQYEKYIALEQQKFSLQAEKQNELREGIEWSDTECRELRERCSNLMADKMRYKEMLRRLPEFHKKVREQRFELKQYQKRIEEKSESLARAETQLEQMDEVSVLLLEKEAKIDELQQTLSESKEHQKEFETRLAAITDAREQMTDQFQNLAQQILEEKSSKFTDQNKANLDVLLTPLRDQLKDFKQKVEDTYDKETRERVSLRSEISQLKGLNERLSHDANNLASALKGDSKTQGNWGELVLTRVLESAGLSEGREFESEAVRKDAMGRNLRPDVIVHLPNDRDIIVDAKVSLTAYERMVSSEDKHEAAEHLKAHLQSIRTHVTQLSAKQYDELKGVRTLDFVLMFVPVEAALHAALREQPELFDEAYKKNIVLVSATTLLTTCRTIQYLWRQQNQSHNAEEIARKAGTLLDKFVSFVDDLEDIGRKLDKAQEAYHSAHKRLSSGRGNLLNQAREVKSLGVDNKKELPSAEVTEILSKRVEKQEEATSA